MHWLNSINIIFLSNWQVKKNIAVFFSSHMVNSVTYQRERCPIKYDFEERVILKDVMIKLANDSMYSLIISILCLLGYVDGWTLDVFSSVLHNIAKKMFHLTSQKRKLQCMGAFGNYEMGNC